MRGDDRVDLRLVGDQTVDDPRGVGMDLSDTLVGLHQLPPFGDEFGRADVLGLRLEQQVDGAAARLVSGSGLLHVWGSR